jgi:hypothetical protein
MKKRPEISRTTSTTSGVLRLETETLHSLQDADLARVLGGTNTTNRAATR